MTAFEQANGRPELLQLIKKRLDFIDAFDRTRADATRFHRELSTLFYVDTIVTTNWDTYFERECGATPIVTQRTTRSGGCPGRKVFKVHGSMNNVGSIVATEADYEACYQSLREGVIGSTLKHILATRTIVFLGYSFRDDDFARIYDLIWDQLGPMLRRPVIVTLDDAFDATRFPGATIVTTDAGYFIQELKRAVAAESDCLLSDEHFDGLGDLIDDVREAQEELLDGVPLKRYPMSIYTIAYQDGLLDALGRMTTMKGSGTYSHRCDVTALGKRYLTMQKTAVRRRRYWDAAYIEGYINGLIFLVADDPDRWHVPLVHMPGAPSDAPIGSTAKLKRLFAEGSTPQDSVPRSEAHRRQF